jgi:voltage-gated potassium channel
MGASSAHPSGLGLDHGTGWALLRQLATMTALLVGYYLLPLERADRPRTLLVLAVGMGGVVALAVWQVRAILKSARPMTQAMQALASAVPLYLVTFATAYYLINWNLPGSFTQRLGRTDALYFTMVVFTTVGFGDIAPASQLARVTVMIQLVGNVLVIGVLVRLVTRAVRLRHDEGAASPATDAAPRGTDAASRGTDAASRGTDAASRGTDAPGSPATGDGPEEPAHPGG